MRCPRNRHPSLPWLVATALSVGVANAAGPCGPRHPCAARNPCAPKVNPCAGRKPGTAMPPGAAKNPCAARIDPKLVARPTNYKPYQGNQKALVAYGEKLWHDTKLSTNGLSCNACHMNHAAFQPTFAQPYPHYVAMTDQQMGLKKVHLDEMIQACMVMPMAAKPLPWDSKELAALVAYTERVQKTFDPKKAAAANPCAAKNPGAARNPCTAKNPCAARR
ncbi:cytochrome c peroxidase [Pelomicrobium methylotrophicum]|uniref:Cytochrome C peroxidase n=1 Tax=Pelomicrobium methylotrophicum TaxID=2602750 RepID=A0A5C7EIR9_9PROT|nr:cytochrome c peroxidase [Pelomicrobium methylotrophicum]TXF11959.1 cytochrome C peroxidase [Pelomicrobium methylotrophicum]